MTSRRALLISNSACGIANIVAGFMNAHLSHLSLAALIASSIAVVFLLFDDEKPK